MQRPQYFLLAVLSTSMIVAACGGTTGTDGGATTTLDGGTVLPDGAMSSDGAAAADGDPTADGDPGAEGDLPPAVDVFAGTPAYTAPASTGRSQLTRHQFEAGLKDYRQSDCAQSGCHDAAAAGTEAGAFMFGGSVYWSDDGTPAANVEIRFVDAAGKAYSVYSNADGAFYKLGTGNFPAHTGARAGTDDVLMSTDVTKSGCNGSKCHDGSTDYPWVTVPRPAP